MPLPAEGEVLVEIRAAGLNPSDVKNVLGRFPYTTLPRTPGRDFSGIVMEGPSDLVGKEIWGTGQELGFTRDGSHARYMTLPVGGVAIKPTTLSFVQAAACGVPFTTAWSALEQARVTPETSLLIIGAAGSVGRAALALGRWRGARKMIGAVRRPEQASALAAEGIASIVLGEPASLSDAMREQLPGGPDVIFDTTGAWLPASVAALARFGRIAVIAAPPDGHVRLPVLDLYRRGGSVVGVNSLLYDTEQCARMLDHLAPAFDSGAVAPPHSPRQAALEDGPERYRAIERGDAEKTVFVMT